MPKITKMFVTLGYVALLFGCSRTAETASPSSFFQCWNFRGAPGGDYEFDFRAIVYPREGVLSFNESCPELRLRMIFNDTPVPAGFNAFRRADENRFELIGIGGRAIVSVGGQEDPDVMTVTVRRLVRASVLPENETQRMLAAMAH
jgi:hypothetical protein